MLLARCRGRMRAPGKAMQILTCKIGGGPAVFLRRAPVWRISRPVSRVLYGLRFRTANVTAIPLARRLPGASSNLPERLVRTDLRQVPRRSYSVLLPVGFAVPLPLPAIAVRSYRTVSPLPQPKRYQPRRSVLCGTVPEASPEGATPPDVIRHRSSMEPGLSSPAVFRHWRGAAVRPTDNDRNGVRRALRQAGRAAAVKKARTGWEGNRPGLGARDTLARINRGPAAAPKFKAPRGWNVRALDQSPFQLQALAVRAKPGD
jgi:hypothetical protein